MTDIEQKALALVNEVLSERHECLHEMLERDWSCWTGALCRAIERHEAFRQEVSDAAEVYEEIGCHMAWEGFEQFIIRKPDPLVEIIGELDDGTWGETKAEYAERLRDALEARGLEIREKNDD